MFFWSNAKDCAPSFVTCIGQGTYLLCASQYLVLKVLVHVTCLTYTMHIAMQCWIHLCGRGWKCIWLTGERRWAVAEYAQSEQLAFFANRATLVYNGGLLRILKLGFRVDKAMQIHWANLERKTCDHKKRILGHPYQRVTYFMYRCCRAWSVSIQIHT